MNSDKTFKSIPFNRLVKPFLSKYGLDAAVLVSEMIYWQTKIRSNIEIKKYEGYFFYEMPKILIATGISPHRQRIAMNKLCEAGILQIKDEKKGIPPKRLYKIDVERYESEALDLYINQEYTAKEKNNIDVKSENVSNPLNNDKSTDSDKKLKRRLVHRNKYGEIINPEDEDIEDESTWIETSRWEDVE